MKENDIAEVLRRSLDNKYELTNTYIYNWECDYFGISNSGLCWEIEIKTSKADFKADFNKVNKHKMLQAAKDKKNQILFRGELKYEFDGGLDWRKMRRTVTGYTRDFKVPKKHREEAKMISSSINFKEVFTPNRFYYACPTNLILKSEVPDYAGLIYVNDEGIIRKVKDAPILHKKKFDMESILLQKFYYLSIHLRNDNIRQQEQLKTLIKLEGNVVEAAKYTLF